MILQIIMTSVERNSYIRICFSLGLMDIKRLTLNENDNKQKFIVTETVRIVGKKRKEKGWGWEMMKGSPFPVNIITFSAASVLLILFKFSY